MKSGKRKMPDILAFGRWRRLATHDKQSNGRRMAGESVES